MWDDRALVLGDPAVTRGQPLARTFFASFWPEVELPRVYYRPLVTLSYRLDHLVHGANPAGYHLTNVALHLGVVLLVFVVARRAGAGAIAAALAATVFGVAPRLTEDVAWISGRTDLLAALGALGAVAVALGAARARWVIAGALVLAGLLCKEVAVAGGAAVLALALRAEPRVAERRAGIAAVAAAALLYGGMRTYALHAAALGPESRNAPLPLGTHAAVALSALGRYAGMVLDALRPRAQIGLASKAEAGWAVLGALVAAAGVALLVRVWRRGDRAELVAAAFVTVGVGLVIHVAPISVNVLAADRFLYFPAAGLAIVAARAAGRIATPRGRIAVAAAAVALAAACAVRTHLRNEDWGDELRFWVLAAEEADQDNAVPPTELGNALFRDGYFDDAHALARVAAHRLDATGQGGGLLAARARGNIASAASALGHYDDARVIRVELAAARPQSAAVRYDLALVDAHRRAFDAAEVELAETLAIDPSFAGAAALLERVREARRVWPELAERSGVEADVARARWLERLGARVEAEAAWRAVVVSAPPGAVDDQALWEGIVFLVERGSVDSARLALGRAVKTPALAARAAVIEPAVAAREELDRERSELAPRIAAIAGAS